MQNYIIETYILWNVKGTINHSYFNYYMNYYILIKLYIYICLACTKAYSLQTDKLMNH